MRYSPRTTPRAHQREALERVAARPSRPCPDDVFAWMMEMGTGKSKVLADEWGTRELCGDLGDLLLWVPAGVMEDWWSDDPDCHLRKHLSDDLLSRVRVAAWRSGSRGARREVDALVRASDRPRVLLVNTEAMSTVERAREACREFLASSARGAMAGIDESTDIRGWRSRRTENVCEIGAAARARRIMTGLIAPKSPLDLYSQFNFLSHRILGFRSFYGYRARYAVMRRANFGHRDEETGEMTRGRDVQIVVGYRNVEELHERIAPYSFRKLKSECLDLPPKTYQFHRVELTDEQRRIYRDLRQNATSQLDAESHVTATMVITRNLRLMQLLCGHVVDEEGREHDVPERRTDGLLEIIERLGRKTIVWFPFERPLLKVAARLRREFGPRSVAMFWGGNRGGRAEDEARFKGDAECQFMLSTQSSGGRGKNWTVAKTMVYFANTENLEHRSQSEDRNHRDGQDESVTCVDLISDGTREISIVKKLRSKIDISSVVMGDGYREWLI